MTCTRCGEPAPFYYPVGDKCLCWRCATLSVFALSEEGVLPPVTASVVSIPADTFSESPAQAEEKLGDAI